MIQQYDNLILQSKEIFSSLFPKSPAAAAAPWPLLPEEELILPSDSAFELGSNGAGAVSGIFFTTSQTMVPESKVFIKDEVFTNPSSFNMESSVNYARFVFVRLKNEAVENKTAQQLYAIFRRLEYVRYHIFLKGFSIRISSSRHKEVSRVAKQSVREGITLAAVAQAFVKAYTGLPEVEAVQLYTAALPKSAGNAEIFNQLAQLSQKSDDVTDSLNVIFKGLKMDCSTCAQKEICDEIDGMKELHKSISE